MGFKDLTYNFFARCQTQGQFNSRIWIDGQKNPQINLPFNFLIQKCFFHNNPIWNINYSK